MQVGDTITDVSVVGVTEKHAICDGDSCLPTHSELEFDAVHQASDDEWDVPEVQTGDRFVAIGLCYDCQANEVLMTTKPSQYSAIFAFLIDKLRIKLDGIGRVIKGLSRRLKMDGVFSAFCFIISVLRDVGKQVSAEKFVTPF